MLAGTRRFGMAAKKNKSSLGLDKNRPWGVAVCCVRADGLVPQDACSKSVGLHRSGPIRRKVFHQTETCTDANA
jgi:hypothetical protein